MTDELRDQIAEKMRRDARALRRRSHGRDLVENYKLLLQAFTLHSAADRITGSTDVETDDVGPEAGAVEEQIAAIVQRAEAAERRATDAMAEAEQLRRELAEERECAVSLRRELEGLRANANGWLSEERQRAEQAEAAIEQARLHVPRLLYEVDADGRRAAVPVAICCEGCTAPDLLADLDRGELTEDVPAWPCPPFLAALNPAGGGEEEPVDHSGRTRAERAEDANLGAEHSRRRRMLRELTQEAIEAGSYAEPMPPDPYGEPEITTVNLPGDRDA